MQTNKSIEDLDLSTESSNCRKHANINSLPQADDTCPTEHIGIQIKSLEDMPRILIDRLARYGIFTVEELFAKYDSEEAMSLSQPLQSRLVRVLDKNGYRFNRCSVEHWPDIFDYLVYKKALRITWDDLELPVEIVHKLNAADISIAKAVTTSWEFLREHLSNREIFVLLRTMIAEGVRPLYISKEQYPNSLDFVTANVDVSVTDFEFSPKIISKLHSHSIVTVNQLLNHSRKELIGNKIIGPTLIGELVRVIGNDRLHLAGDEIYKCDCCKEIYISAVEDSTEHLCSYCRDKKKRISKIKDFHVTVEGPEYGSYTDGTKGFTIFATIQNNTKKMTEVQVKEFMVFHKDRQWASTYHLNGYDFKKDYIMPESSKTTAKVWCGYPWSVHKLEDGDYLNFAIAANNKIFSFKFIIQKDVLVLDDYYAY